MCVECVVVCVLCVCVLRLGLVVEGGAGGVFACVLVCEL